MNFNHEPSQLVPGLCHIFVHEKPYGGQVLKIPRKFSVSNFSCQNPRFHGSQSQKTQIPVLSVFDFHFLFITYSNLLDICQLQLHGISQTCSVSIHTHTHERVSLETHGWRVVPVEHVANRYGQSDTAGGKSTVAGCRSGIDWIGSTVEILGQWDVSWPRWVILEVNMIPKEKVR